MGEPGIGQQYRKMKKMRYGHHVFPGYGTRWIFTRVTANTFSYGALLKRLTYSTLVDWIKIFPRWNKRSVIQNFKHYICIDLYVHLFLSEYPKTSINIQTELKYLSSSHNITALSIQSETVCCLTLVIEL